MPAAKPSSALTVLTPAARVPRPLPRVALWLWLGAIAISVPNLPTDFPKQALAPLSVKGKTAPVQAYRVWPPPGSSLPPPSIEAQTAP